MDSGVEGAPVVENLIGLQVRSPSAVDSGVQGAPIVEQLTELIRFQVGSLLAWILASRGLL